MSPEWAGENEGSSEAKEQTGNGAREPVPVLLLETDCNESLWGEADVTVENGFNKSCH